MIFHEIPCAVPVHEMMIVRVVPVHKVCDNSPPLRKITNGLIIQISARVKTAEIAGLSHIL